MRARWVVLAAIALFLAGCSGSTEGTAVADAPKEPWDPCSIPADAIAATGLNPEIKRSGWGEDIRLPDWNACLWGGPAIDEWYFFGVLSSTQFTVADLEKDSDLIGFSDVSFGSRNGVTFYARQIPQSERCEFAVDTENGTVRMYVDTMGGLEPRFSPCDVVVQQAESLLPYVPAGS